MDMQNRSVGKNEGSSLLMSVIRSLSTSENYQQREIEKAKLEKAYRESDEILDKLISENASDFSTIIQTFSKISTNMINIMKTVKDVKEKLQSSKVLLNCKRDDLKVLWSDGLQQKFILELLEKIDYIKSVPAKIEKRLLSKTYYPLSEMYNNSTKILETDLKQIDGLREIRAEIITKKDKIYLQIIQDLRIHLYLKTTMLGNYKPISSHHDYDKKWQNSIDLTYKTGNLTISNESGVSSDSDSENIRQHMELATKKLYSVKLSSPSPYTRNTISTNNNSKPFVRTSIDEMVANSMKSNFYSESNNNNNIYYDDTDSDESDKDVNNRRFYTQSGGGGIWQNKRMFKDADDTKSSLNYTSSPENELAIQLESDSPKFVASCIQALAKLNCLKEGFETLKAMMQSDLCSIVLLTAYEIKSKYGSNISSEPFNDEMTSEDHPELFKYLLQTLFVKFWSIARAHKYVLKCFAICANAMNTTNAKDNKESNKEKVAALESPKIKQKSPKSSKKEKVLDSSMQPPYDIIDVWAVIQSVLQMTLIEYLAMESDPNTTNGSNAVDDATSTDPENISSYFSTKSQPLNKKPGFGVLKRTQPLFKFDNSAQAINAQRYAREQRKRKSLAFLATKSPTIDEYNSNTASSSFVIPGSLTLTANSQHTIDQKDTSARFNLLTINTTLPILPPLLTMVHNSSLMNNNVVDTNITVNTATLNRTTSFLTESKTESPFSNPIMVCKPDVKNLRYVYTPIKGFCQKLEKEIGITQPAHCILFNFFTDYIKEIYLVDIHNSVANKIEKAVKAPDAWKTLVEYDTKGVSQKFIVNHQTSRPLLHHTYVVDESLAELRRIINDMPDYSNQFLLMICKILQGYKDICHNMYKSIVTPETEEKRIISAMWAKDEDINRFLRSLPNWQVMKGKEELYMRPSLANQYERNTLISINSIYSPTAPGIDAYSFGNLNTATSNFSSKMEVGYTKESEILVTNLADEEINEAIPEYEILSSSNSWRTLALLHESLEWFAHYRLGLVPTLNNTFSTNTTQPTENAPNALKLDSLPQYTLAPDGFLAQLIRNNSSTLAAGLASSSENPNITTMNDVGSVKVPISNFIIDSVRDFAQAFEEISETCLLVLHLEIRVHCFYYLKPLPQQFERENEPIDGIQSLNLPYSLVSGVSTNVVRLNRDLSLFEETLSTSLQKHKVKYVVDGVGNLISTMLINRASDFAKITPDIIKIMCQNLICLQQNLTNITMNRESDLDKARQFYELLAKKPEELFEIISHEEHHGKLSFSLTDYRNALKIIQKSLNIPVNSQKQQLQRLEELTKKPVLV